MTDTKRAAILAHLKRKPRKLHKALKGNEADTCCHGVSRQEPCVACYQPLGWMVALGYDLPHAFELHRREINWQTKRQKAFQISFSA